MDAEELRGMMKKCLDGLWSGDYSDCGLTQPVGKGALPFHSWWYNSYMTAEQRRGLNRSNYRYLIETMLDLPDEELMFLWAVYLM